MSTPEDWLKKKLKPVVEKELVVAGADYDRERALAREMTDETLLRNFPLPLAEGPWSSAMRDEARHRIAVLTDWRISGISEHDLAEKLGINTTKLRAKVSILWQLKAKLEDNKPLD